MCGEPRWWRQTSGSGALSCSSWTRCSPPARSRSAVRSIACCRKTRFPSAWWAASGGNFARAVAHAARALGVEAHLFVPDTSPTEKIDPLRSYGAVVHLISGMYPDALAASEAYAAEHGGLFAHAYDQPEMVAGAGTLGLELDAQIPDADTVLVAVGGGGLIAGIAAW